MEGAVDYRSFVMTPRDGIKHFRQSTYKNTDMRRSTMETSSSFFSLSGSSSSSSKWIPRRNSSWTIEAQDAESNCNQQWTAVERAERVARDSALLSLLKVEVEKSGVVTAAGYKAVHQKFLYSDVVEEEMNRRCRASRRKTTHLTEERGSLFGDLVKSIQHSCSSNDLISMAKKIGLGNDGASVDNHDPLSSSTFSDRNLAPGSRQSLSEKDWEDLQDLDEDSVDSVTAKHSFVSSCKDENKPGQCRIQRKARVILSEVCLDPDEIDVKTNNMHGSEREDDDASSVSSFSSKRSYKDECGWLPWPVEQH